MDKYKCERQNYAVGHFYKERTENGKKVVELLPKSWLIEGDDEEWSCRWPPKKDQKSVINWVKDRKAPQNGWEIFKNLKILCWAESYEDGIRRLNRSYSQANDIVTDTDIESPRSKITVISKKRARELMTKNESSSNSSDDEQPMYKRKSKSIKKKRLSSFINTNNSDVENSPIKKKNQQADKSSGENSPTRTNSDLLAKNQQVCTSSGENSPKRTNSGLSAKILREIENKESTSTMQKDAYTQQKHSNTSGYFTPRSVAGYGSSYSCKEKNDVHALRQHITDPGLGAIADFLSVKLDLAFEKLERKLTNTRRSLTYDLQQKLDRFSLPMGDQDSYMDIFGVEFPIKTMNDFEKFENNLDTNKGDAGMKEEAKKKRTFLKKKYTNQLSQYHEFTKAANAIIGGTIDRDMQLLFSGQGRETQNIQAKRAYNQTVAFKCMEEVLLEKFPNPKISVLTATSNYLSGAKARKTTKAKEAAQNI